MNRIYFIDIFYLQNHRINRLAGVSLTALLCTASFKKIHYCLTLLDLLQPEPKGSIPSGWPSGIAAPRVSQAGIRQPRGLNTI